MHDITPIRPPLSTATQAVWDAFEHADCDPYMVDLRKARLAAALRAAVAATQMRQYGDRWICDADELLAIVAELENAS